MSSLTMPSTPSSRRSCIWPGSFTVQTWTGRPSSWAQESIRRSARGTNPRRTGIWAQAGALGTALPGTSPQAARRNRRTSPGPMDVHSRGPSAACARRRRRSENERCRPGQGRRQPGSSAPGVQPHGRLRVDVDTDVGPTASTSANTGSGPSPDAGGAYLSPGQRPELTGPVGHPVQPVVVEGHQDVVGGHLHVGLKVAVAQLDGPCERGHRVLPIERSAAVGDRQRPRRAPGMDGPRLVVPSAPALTATGLLIRPPARGPVKQQREDLALKMACPMTQGW